MNKRPIAVGRTAEIYAWDEGQVLKLFFDWVGEEAVRREQKITHAVYEAGLPVPRLAEAVCVEGRQGLVYERIAGQTMLQALQARPWTLFHSARRLALQHAAMHALHLVDLPSQRQRLATKIHNAQSLPAQRRQTIVQALHELPQGNRVCHGDFHPGNVILAKRGPVVIDWIDATGGNPLADVARTSVLLLGEAQKNATPTAMKVFIRLYHDHYLRTILRTRPAAAAEIRRWRPIVAAARLSEGIEELEAWLVAQAVTPVRQR